METLPVSELKIRVERSPVTRAAVISFGGASIGCTVRNISTGGAMLEVESPLGVPDRFALHVGTAQASYLCRLVWRKEKQIGIAFLR